MNTDKKLLPDIDWEKVYGKLGIEADFGNLWKEPPVESWYIYVLPGVTEKLLDLGFKALGVETQIHIVPFNDPEPISYMVNDRVSGCDRYRVEVRRSLSPDSEYLGKSAKLLEEQWIGSVTLLEMLLLQYGYFLQTGFFLDEDFSTICSGTHVYLPHHPQREIATESLSPRKAIQSEKPRIVTIHHELDFEDEDYGIRSVSSIVPDRTA